MGVKPLPMHGPLVLQTYSGFKTAGLKTAAGTRVVSDQADVLGTTLVRFLIDEKVFPSDGSKGIPRDISIKAVDDVLLLSHGPSDGVAEYAANTWTELIPISDLFALNGADARMELWLGAAAESDIQFKIFY